MKNLLLACGAGAIAVGLILTVMKAKRWLAIDACLDAGGSWNYEKECCEYEVSKQPTNRQE